MGDGARRGVMGGANRRGDDKAMVKSPGKERWCGHEINEEGTKEMSRIEKGRWLYCLL